MAEVEPKIVFQPVVQGSELCCLKYGKARQGTVEHALKL